MAWVIPVRMVMDVVQGSGEVVEAGLEGDR
jgi:hypothetical protein